MVYRATGRWDAMENAKLAAHSVLPLTMANPAANSPYDYGKFHTQPGDRGASFTFVAILILSVPLLLYWGRSDWFGMDDWDLRCRVGERPAVVSNDLCGRTGIRTYSVHPGRS
jgi:hypothetical protein